MPQLQREIEPVMFWLRNTKKENLAYIKELIDLIVYQNKSDIIIFVDKIDIDKNTKIYLKTTMTKFKKVNQDLEKK